MKTILLFFTIMATGIYSNPELDNISGVFNPIRVFKIEAAFSGDNLKARFLQEDLYTSRITLNEQVYRVKRTANRQTLSKGDSKEIISIRKGKTIRFNGQRYRIKVGFVNAKLLAEDGSVLAQIRTNGNGFLNKVRLEIEEQKDLPDELWPYLIVEGVRLSQVLCL